MEDITLKLEGQEIDARALQEGLGALLDMLKSVGEEGDSAPVLSGLEIGSAIATLSAEQAQVNVINDGLDALQAGGSLPDAWNERTLEGVRVLHKTLQRQGVSGVSLSTDTSTVAIDTNLIKTLDEIAEGYRQVLGTITGRLYRYSNRNTPEASIEDENTGRAVKLSLPSELSELAISLLDKRVTARGFIRVNPWTNRYVSMSVRGLAMRSSNVGSVTSLEGARGLLKGLTPDGLDSVEIIRRQRDEIA
ncbi:hypothetical protein [Gulosibacter chungangensis]|uniref:Uncharacterized protein n=1 Tax=Gulosibacter chungangensis TaxID=979746 RepID=A0A7J5BBN2_9MICO|nr:hypothetical protein [Gulosibacter chungangensis]KAB1643524.1 hypothetical protein F8O05_06460 [Gulosibacter chungangensis]